MHVVIIVWLGWVGLKLVLLTKLADVLRVRVW